MIRINLLGDDTVIDHTAKIVLLSYAASQAFLIVACILLYTWSTQHLSNLESDSERLQTELVRLREVTKEVRELETKKVEIANKLDVMAQLKSAKKGPVRVLDDLNTAIPDRAWLDDFKEKGGHLLLSGVALDNETIASFMKNLEKSNYFKTVDLEQAMQAVRKDVKVKNFSLKSAISYTGVFPKAEEETEEKKK
jgi:type IV pilus assembly protein PilN